MKNKLTVKISATLLIDIVAVFFIYYLRDLSQFINYPLYLIDPMRMMVILAIAFTPRWNGWFLALLLPFFSYYMGSHPHLIKTSIMAAELLLNVWLFWFLYDKIKFSLLAILLSIMFSKAVYYLLKYICIQAAWLEGDLITTPLDTQVITTLAFSVFIFIVFLVWGKPKRR